jgi:uncharacterized Zn finger protein
MSSKEFKLTEALIKKCCSEKIFTRGEEYIDLVSTLVLRGDEISVKVYGSMPRPYRVRITFNERNWKNGRCDCPAGFRPCKHIIAVLLKIFHEGVDIIEPRFQDSLKCLEADELRNLLLALVEKKPHLIDDIQAILSGETIDEDELDEYDEDQSEWDFY